jgi:hypothetical protein
MADGVDGTKLRSPAPTAGTDGLPLVPCVPPGPLPKGACPWTAVPARSTVATIIIVKGVRMALTLNMINSARPRLLRQHSQKIRHLPDIA